MNPWTWCGLFSMQLSHACMLCSRVHSTSPSNHCGRIDWSPQVISNCVVNLSPDKPRVIREAYRVLRPGGELYFSDVYCDRRLPEVVQKDEVGRRDGGSVQCLETDVFHQSHLFILCSTLPVPGVVG